MPENMTDHTAIDYGYNAQRRVELALTRTEDSMESLVIAQIATAEATLALVEAQREANEQARIANLIAMASIPDLNGFENDVYDARTTALMEGLLDSETAPAVPGYGPAGIVEHVFIRPDIKKGLDLS